MPAYPCVDELGVDTHLAARLADAAFQNMTHTKLPPDPMYIGRLALVGEGRIPRDNEQSLNFREVRDDVF